MCCMRWRSRATRSTARDVQRAPQGCAVAAHLRRPAMGPLAPGSFAAELGDELRVTARQVVLGQQTQDEGRPYVRCRRRPLGVPGRSSSGPSKSRRWGSRLFASPAPENAAGPMSRAHQAGAAQGVQRRTCAFGTRLRPTTTVVAAAGGWPGVTVSAARSRKPPAPGSAHGGSRLRPGHAPHRCEHIRFKPVHADSTKHLAFGHFPQHRSSPLRLEYTACPGFIQRGSGEIPARAFAIFTL